MPFLVLAHVETDHPVLAPEERLRKRAGEFGLADAGGAEEEEAPDRAAGVGQTGPRAQDGVGDGGHRFVLADDALVQMLFQSQQSFPLLLGEAADGNSGLAGHDVGDVFDADLGDVTAGLLFVVSLGDPLLEVGESVAQLGRALVLLGCDGLVLVPVELLHFAFQGADVGAAGGGAQPDPCAGLVHEVDRLVGQVAVGEVAVGQLDGGEQSLVGVPDLVMGFVAVLETPQDLDGVRRAGLGDQNRLEPAGERGVLLDVAAVLLQRAGSHDMEFAAGQSGLEHIARVHRAALGAAARPDDGMQFVDEDDQLARVGADFFDETGEPFLEVPTETGTGDDS